MRNKKGKSKVGFAKYLPVLLILLSITIMVGSTFAYFTDRKDTSSDLTFSKVELSAETTLGIDGVLRDVIPGSKIVDGPVAFSKAIDSEAIYVRAKISFSLPTEYEDDENMQQLLDTLRNSSDFNIKSEAQNGAVWSEKMGNYFYLLDNTNKTNLKYVDTIDTYTLSNEVVVPRDLEQLEGNAQYMKSINFHIAFEAIQADNVSAKLVDLQEVFNEVFPMSEKDSAIVKVVLKNVGGESDYSTLTLEKGLIDEPVIELPLDENGTSINILEGWYLDKALTEKFDITKEVTEDIALYPKLIAATPQNLTYTPRYEDTNNPDLITSYSVGGENCEDEHVVIPEYYLGKPVTLVGGFSRNEFIKSIVLPNTINNIGGSAFYYATNLETIKMSNNVTYMGSAAFSHCESLKSITLPIKLKTLWRDVFEHTDKLEEVIIEATNFQASAPMYGAFYVAGKYSSGITVKVKANVEKIPDKLFYTFYTANESYYYPSVKEVIFEEGSKCTTIETQAFYNCYQLEKINLPDSLKTIGRYAFFRTGFEKFIVPKNVIEIQESAFINCSKLIEIVNLSSLDIIKGATTYGSIATNVLGVYNEDITKVETSGDYTFFAGGEGNTHLLKYNGTATDLVLPNNYNGFGYNIHANAFYNCSSITNVTLPGCVTSLGEKAFYNCTNLTNINLENVTNIGGYAFYYCNMLNNIQLSSDLITIPTYTFYRCTSLEKVIIPENVTTLGTYSFYYCEGLKSIILPGNITSIGNTSFSMTNNAYILCANDTVASLASSKGSANVYVVDSATDFSGITFTDVENTGAVNATYNDGTNYYVRTGSEGGYVYYKKYTA